MENKFTIDSKAIATMTAEFPLTTINKVQHIASRYIHIQLNDGTELDYLIVNREECEKIVKDLKTKLLAIKPPEDKHV